MIRAAVPARVAMSISGHRTKQVFDHYNIVMEKYLSEAVSKTAEYVKSLPPTQRVVPIEEAIAKQAW